MTYFGVLPALLAVIVATPLVAQDYRARDGDVLFGNAELSARLSGRTLVFFDDGQSVYQADGKYQYTYGGGGTWYGYWDVKDGSFVCVTFVTGVERCDQIVENDGRLVVLTDQGARFPVRP